MYAISFKKALNQTTFLYRIKAPLIANKAKAGQFVLIRIDDKGERIPLTVAGTDTETGEITIIFQVVGKTTEKLANIVQGGNILDVFGPLGQPTHLSGYKRAAVIGGGLGAAIAYPQAKELHKNGVSVDIIAGFRNKDLVILEDELRACCDNLMIATDDGSNGNKGLVTDILRKQIESGVEYDVVVAVGPPVMMKFVSLLTKEYNIKTIVSLNPIMVDGTGMCGCCRVSVGGGIKFACVDGPDFDGHAVDFDELMQRLKIYDGNEKQAHICKIGLDAK